MAIRLLLTVIGSLLAATVALADSADGLNNDYYFDRSDRNMAGLLRNVESHHLPQGLQAARRGSYENAWKDFRFILAYFPNHPEGLMALADLCLTWKSPKCDIEDWFPRAIDRNPTASSTFVVQGIYLLRAKRNAEAITALKQGAELAPNSVNAHYNLGLAYVATKQYALANEHAQKAYALGTPLPGLREQLKRAGHWRPVEPVADGPAPGSGAGSTTTAEPPTSGRAVEKGAE